tara:strand:- start:7300 stop:7422 length:123 start_codon:yes stop_codon:yes gene_type:complete
MKKPLTFIFLIIALNLLNSCSIYQEPCEGVAGIQEEQISL